MHYEEIHWLHMRYTFDLLSVSLRVISVYCWKSIDLWVHLTTPNANVMFHGYRLQ